MCNTPQQDCYIYDAKVILLIPYINVYYSYAELKNAVLEFRKMAGVEEVDVMVRQIHESKSHNGLFIVYAYRDNCTKMPIACEWKKNVFDFLKE